MRVCVSCSRLQLAYAMRMWLDSAVMNALKPPRGPSHLPRRALLLASAALLCLCLLPVAAQADSASTLTVVGTSDVSDSGLMQNLIQPGFHAAYPQFTFKYIGTATGTAINDAETGSVGASVLLVHAASLENQFVAGGYSSEQYGRALFTNDFVLAGPSGDPAGVAANGASNIVQAFADVAAAGNSGTATFVSRGGTPGTTVEEHEIWGLVQSNGLAPGSLNLCQVSAADGGGLTPVTAASGLNGQPCGGLPPAGDLPAWYVTTGLTQGPNVLDAYNCTAFPSGANSCYVLTDRGTYDYLSSGLDPAAGATPVSATAFPILTRGPQPASAPGGMYLLTNYFHGYIINPNQTVLGGSTLEPVNPTAALDFMNYLTSPGFQSELKTYLDDTSDTGGPPFVADASPSLTAAGFPATDNAGAPVTVTGSLTNAEPGYPALTGQTVNVDIVEGGVDISLAHVTTTPSGTYSIAFVPPASGSYQVTTGPIAQIESGNTLSPAFGDLLQPASTAAVSVNVQAAVNLSSATATPGGVTVSGGVAPAAPDGNATVSVLARPSTSTGAFSTVGGATLATGQSAYAATGTLSPGTYQVEVTYKDPGQLLGATSSAATVTVTAPVTAGAHTVSFKKVTVKNGKVTVTGTLKPGPTSSGAKVELLALQAGKISKTKTKTKKKKKGIRAHAASLKSVAKTSVGTGKTSFTIKTTLKRGYLYILELEYVQTGQTSTFSKLSSLDVH
jgi:tungstate transport system substrate-binding protein